MTGQSNLDETSAWLDAWFRGATGWVHLCSADDWNGRAFNNRAEALADAAARMSRNPMGVYFRVTTLAARPAAGRRGGKDQSFELLGMHSDIDFGVDGHAHAAGENVLPLPPDETAAWGVADRSGLPAPSFVVNSGGGLNVYWKLREPLVLTDQNRKRAEDLSATWQRILGESARKLGNAYGTGVGDPSRVLRLPGSDNLKTDTARPCRLVYSTGVLYSIQELADAAAENAPTLSADLHQADGPTPPPRPTTPSPPRAAGQTGPFDVLGEMASTADILGPAGWSYVGSDRDGEMWLRPSGPDGPPSSKYSARARLGGKPVIVCFSESAGLPTGAGCQLTYGRTFAHLWHRGDEHSAAQDLIRAAAGDPSATNAARGLPRAILAAIRDQCGVTPWTAPRAQNSSPIGALAGLLRSILRADEADRLPRLRWAADRTFQHAACGLFDAKTAGDALLEAAIVAGIDESAARNLISSAHRSTTKGTAP